MSPGTRPRRVLIEPGRDAESLRSPLGWDGIGAIVILLVASVSLRDRVSPDNFVFVLLRVLWWILYAASTARLVQRFGTQWLTWLIRHQPALCVLLALAMASSLWSLVPALTLHKATSLLGTTVLGVFIAYACTPRQVMQVLYWTFVVLIVSSLAVDAVLPNIDGARMGRRGITVYKNTLGAIAAVATLFVLAMTARRQIHPFAAVVLCAMSLFALAQTRSRTSVVALALCLIPFAYFAVASVTRRSSAASWSRVWLALVLGVSIIPFLLAPLSPRVSRKDDPLGGRLEMWAAALAILRERPLTGDGYRAVWGRSHQDDPARPQVPVTANRSPPSAHNSIVHVASELGFPAAIVACALLFGALSNAGRLFERAPSAFSFFALLFLIAFTVIGFTEALLLQIHGMFWILFVAVTVTVRRSLEETGMEQ